MKGKLIVLEGTDGSGKATQTELLYQWLKAQGYACRKVDFPRYKEESSALIRLYLGGAFGTKASDVNAYAASTFYAVDRYASYRQDWGAFYEDGGIVVADRYTTSNAVHQAAKLPAQEREDYLDWLYEFEFERMGLPKPDLVFYLDVPAELSQRLLHRRQEQTGTQADLHEQDLEYLRHCRENGCQVARKLGWRRIACNAGETMRTVEQIHQEIVAAVQELDLS